MVCGGACVNRRMIVFQIFYVNVRVHVSRVGANLLHILQCV